MRSSMLFVPVLALLFGCSSNVSLGDVDPSRSTIDLGSAPTDPPPAAPAAYPAGPYGNLKGNTIANFEWDGYRDGVGEVTKISLNDYYDPDGKKGINAIMLKLSAQW